MAGLVLHSFRRCPYAIRVRMTLEEKQLRYTTIEEDLSHPTPELLRLNPEGSVPVLIHQGAALLESAVITEYLDDVFPAKPLRPADPLSRARIRLWTVWCDTKIKPDLDSFKYEWTELSEDDRTALIDRLRGCLTKIEEPLRTQAFLMGDELTLADVHLFPFYRQLRRVEKPLYTDFFSFPKLDDWLTRITSRDTFKRVMALPTATQAK